jgi:hypothetical protein
LYSACEEGIDNIIEIAQGKAILEIEAHEALLGIPVL